MDYKYLMKVAIDFGSTNTVMAWRVYDVRPDGGMILSETQNAPNYIHRIPSMMIFKDDNPGNEKVPRDLFGEDAVKAANDGNTPPVICDNFKQYLYTAAPDSEDYNKGVRLTTLFFKYLREEYRQIYNRFSSSVAQELKVVLYLSTPVRANPAHRSLMRKIAQDAGFIPENGVTEICTDYDEARCVVRYAMDQNRDSMQNVLSKAGQPGGAVLLFVDVGGSTMDVSLENLRIGADGAETMENIASWPNGDVTYPLGGCLVDEAIRDYLIDKGFADREYTLAHWEHGDGKFRFRAFKEENNLCLSDGKPVDKLGRVGAVCYDYDEDIFPDRNYLKAPVSEKISGGVYETVICKEYIDRMHDALAEVFGKQKPIEGRPAVKPADVDAVFLAGDGSRLYFIRKVLLGETGGRDPGFAQIKADPNLLFDRWENPSQCCALGALVEQENVAYPSYARERYYLRVALFESSGELEGIFKANPALLSKEKTSYANANGEERAGYFIGESQMVLADQYQMLPLKVQQNVELHYTDHGFERIIFQICLFRVDSSGELQLMGTPCLHMGTRTIFSQMMQVVKGTIATAPLLGGIVIDLGAKLIGKETHAAETVINTLMENIGQGEAQASVGVAAEMSENSTVTVTVKLDSATFKMDIGQFTMEL